MVTVVIPTFRQRTSWLARTLTYYSTIGFPFPILIADSGEPDAQAANERLVAGLRQSLALDHRRYPQEQDIFGKLADALEAIDTPCAVVCGDDDFLVTNGVAHCVAYLEDHPDVAAVDGREIKLRTAADAKRDQQPRAVIHRQVSIDSDSPAVRLQWHWSHYWPTFYCVQRREGMARTLSLAGEHGANSLFGELTQSGLTIIGGKYHNLDTLYLIRHVRHDELHMPLWHEMVRSPTFQTQTTDVCRRLAEELGPETGSLDEREQIVRAAFRRFVKPLQRRRSDSASRLVPAIAVIPRALRKVLFGGGLREALTSPRRFLETCWVERQETQQGEWSLSSLRDPTSPHFDAFDTIYESFVRWPKGIPANFVSASDQPGPSGSEVEP
ncbi:MAG: TIGR00180 family glycosyltransferase [Acidimicrobiia bacterium]